MTQAAKDTAQTRRIWGWWFFDWASQPYHTLLVTFVFGPFFASVATGHYIAAGLEGEAARAQAQANWSLCLTVTGLLIGLSAPFLGALADLRGRRLPWIVFFSILYVIGSGALWFTAPDGHNMLWMLIFFGIGFLGAEFALIFVNAQLPSLGTSETVGEVSGSGFAFGYLGGVLSLVLVLVFLVEQDNGRTLAGFAPLFGLLDGEAREGTRATGLFVALWYLIFMLPYFAWVHDPAGKTGQTGRAAAPRRANLAIAAQSVLQSVRALAHRPSLARFLAASMLYRDALNGLYGFGGVYAGLVLGWPVAQIGLFGIIAAISAALLSWIGGKADRRFGPKPVIATSILVLALVCLLVVGMSRSQIFGIALPEGSTLPDKLFLGCGVLIGGFGGILQATSRTLMVRHTTPDTATEAFGLYGLSGRATAFLAPALIGLVTTLSESARIGITPVIALFALGLFLLLGVRNGGEQEART